MKVLFRADAKFSIGTDYWEQLGIELRKDIRSVMTVRCNLVSQYDCTGEQA